MKICTIIPNFNSGNILLACLDSLISQEIPEGHEHEIIVVDDGSTDGSSDHIAAKFGDTIKIIRLASNSGRSVARNTGAECSDSEFLYFVDSDCIPEGNLNINALIASIEMGNDLIFGKVIASGKGFWDMLQNHGNIGRLAEFKNGKQWIFTTSNVCIRRNLFNKTGGFDSRFNRHGFEDRDIFIRLLRSGARCTYIENASVVHCDKISLSSVSKKMFNAGIYSAHEFETTHPVEYREMSYSHIDCNLNPKLGYIDFLVWPIIKRLAASEAYWIESRILPFWIRCKAAQIIYGLHYLHGTAESHRSKMK